MARRARFGLSSAIALERNEVVFAFMILAGRALAPTALSDAAPSKTCADATIA